MKRRDVPWIAAIWVVALVLSAMVAASADDDQVVVAGVLTAINGSIATGLYVWVRRNVHDGRDVLWIAGIWVPLLGVLILIGATSGNWHNAGYLAGFVGALATGWYVDRRRRINKARKEVEEEVERAHRRCPECGARMRREADTCPVLKHRSTPWTRQGGRWWLLGPDGGWQLWDEEGGRFEPYQAPGAPAATHDAKL